jgi:outer membrane protein assembly factor BamB
VTYRTAAPPLVLFGGYGRVKACDPRSGAVLWEHSFAGASSASALPGHEFALVRVLLERGTVFAFGVDAVTSGTGFFAVPQAIHVVVALDQTTGAVLWRTALGENRESVGTMLLAEDVLFATSSTYLFALDREDGRLLWSTESSQGRGAIGVSIAVEGHAVQADATGRK